ncbi:hypothetical protein WJX84_005589 [Apatococcus fuscideae]|uniref:Uncharacterized protein n=1 Tax=Apatococcus fuscideae TaxID=2026836 RepID=A0AAW1SHZ2_9CHLO
MDTATLNARQTITRASSYRSSRSSLPLHGAYAAPDDELWMRRLESYGLAWSQSCSCLALLRRSTAPLCKKPYGSEEEVLPTSARGLLPVPTLCRQAALTGINGCRIPSRAADTSSVLAQPFSLKP